MDIKTMNERDLHAHIKNALSTPSGKVLREFLRQHSFMAPELGLKDWQSGEQVTFRYGRMTLFQLLEYFEDTRNFKENDA